MEWVWSAIVIFSFYILSPGEIDLLPDQTSVGFLEKQTDIKIDLRKKKSQQLCYIILSTYLWTVSGTPIIGSITMSFISVRAKSVIPFLWICRDGPGRGRGVGGGMGANALR
jgi:hypothetical protein